MDFWMFAVKREFYKDNFSRLIHCNVSSEELKRTINLKIFLPKLKKNMLLFDWVQMK